MSTKNLPTTKGPFKAEYLHCGDPYELSKGHAIQCLPTGGRGSRANLLGGAVLASDPAVAEAGADTGVIQSDAWTTWLVPAVSFSNPCQ